MGFNDGLAVFDPLQRTWNVLAPESVGKLSIDWWKGKYITEHKGELLLIYAFSRSAKPTMFKLDRTSMIWEEVKTLDGFTLFVPCHLIPELTFLDGWETVSSSPKFVCMESICISYSFDNCIDYPCNQCHDTGDHYYPPENIWIDPPQDFTGFAWRNLVAQV